MSRALALLLLSFSFACGYAFRSAGAARPIAVLPVLEDGLDLDAAGDLAHAVRSAIARRPPLELARGDRSDDAARLEVRLLSARTGLATISDPNARAAQYVVSLRSDARLLAPDGTVLWRSRVVIGESAYLSTPGGMTSLDGARRRALQRASEDAAEKLVDLLLYTTGA